MLPKCSPSKAQRGHRVEFLRTPGRPLRRRSLCGGSPIWETPHPASPAAPSTPKPHWATPPIPMQLQGSPLASSVDPETRRMATTPLTPLSPSDGLERRGGCAVLGSSFFPSTPTAMSTPSKVVSIRTPLRPCSRGRAKEMQDDIRVAIEEQSAALLKVCLQRRHLCAGEHALHEAVRQAHAPAVRLLLQAKAEPNARCLCLENGCEFPLQLAVSSPSFLRGADRSQVVELLLRAGARSDRSRANAEANSPLHDAARRGDIEVAQLLLKHGADPNRVNGYGERPMLCMFHGCEATSATE